MAPRIVVTNKAYSDLESSAEYIAADNEDAAIRFIEAACKAFHLLAELPKSGALRPCANPRIKEIRIWPIRGFDKFLVVYRQIPRGIEVYRVVHAARDVNLIVDTLED